MKQYYYHIDRFPTAREIAAAKLTPDEEKVLYAVCDVYNDPKVKPLFVAPEWGNYYSLKSIAKKARARGGVGLAVSEIGNIMEALSEKRVRYNLSYEELEPSFKRVLLNEGCREEELKNHIFRHDVNVLTAVRMTKEGRTNNDRTIEDHRRGQRADND